MTVARSKWERIGIDLVLAVALLMFFAPLVNMRGAFAGDEPASGLNVRSSLKSLRSAFDNTSSHRAGDVTASPNSADLKQFGMPFALRNEWLASLLIYGAVLFAGLALLDQISVQKRTGILSLTGGFLGALAVVQLVSINNGVQIWTRDLIDSGVLGSAQDPFVAMRTLMARSFVLSPGIGLYMMTACLFLASSLAYSSAIPRMQTVVRRHPRVEFSESIRIRPIDAGYPEEISTTVDVSKGGVYFETVQTHYYTGMEVRLTRGSKLGDSAMPEERASVVRVDSLADGKHGVAIRIIYPDVPQRAL